MAGVNRVHLIGFLGADPEVKFLPTGQAVCNFRMATGESWTDKAGDRKEKTEWHRIVAFGKTAEICGEYLAKGRQVYVEGKLQTRQWEDKDGNKRSTTEIVAQQVTFLGGKETAPRAIKETKQEPDHDYGPPPMTDAELPF